MVKDCQFCIQNISKFWPLVYWHLPCVRALFTAPPLERSMRCRFDPESKIFFQLQQSSISIVVSDGQINWSIGALFNLPKPAPPIYSYFSKALKVSTLGFTKFQGLLKHHHRHRWTCNQSVFCTPACLERLNLWDFWKCSTLNEILVFSIKLVSKVS